MKFKLWLPVVLLAAAPAQALPLGLPGALLPAATPIHGCHGSYGHDVRGWHQHRTRCEPTARTCARQTRHKTGDLSRRAFSRKLRFELI